MLAGDRLRALGQRFGCSGVHELAAVLAAARTEVDHPVGALEDVQVVLDDHDGVALAEQGVERVQELGHVMHVQACGGFVEHEQRVPLTVAPGQESGQLDALGLPAAQGIGALAQRDVSQANVGKPAQFVEQSV